jgi:hypothetical protein
MAILYRFSIVLTTDFSDKGLVFGKLAFQARSQIRMGGRQGALACQTAGFEVSNTGSVPVFDTLDL